MSIEFSPPPPKKIVHYREDVVFDGEIIGWVEVRDGSGGSTAHAVLYLKGVGDGHGEFIQGFAETKKGAVFTALISSRRRFEKAISKIDAITERMSD